MKKIRILTYASLILVIALTILSFIKLPVEALTSERIEEETSGLLSLNSSERQSLLILPSPKIEMINSCKLLVVTGANNIKDNFEIITSFDQKTLDKIKVPIALMGIGHYGVDDTNKFGFDENSKLLTKKILERWRKQN